MDDAAQQQHAERLADERRRMRDTGLTRQQIRDGAQTDGELVAAMEQRIAAIEGRLARLHGKDGIKVAGDCIALDPAGIPGGAGGGDESNFVAFQCNVIENRQLSIRTVMLQNGEEVS